MATRRGGCCCAAINCAVTTYNSQGLSLFRFPKDELRCKKWRINIRRADLDKKSLSDLNKQYRICAKHFEESQFMNDKHNSLVWNAIPTLFDIQNQPPKLESSRRVITRQDRPTLQQLSTSISTVTYISDGPDASSQPVVESCGISVTTPVKCKDTMPATLTVTSPCDAPLADVLCSPGDSCSNTRCTPSQGDTPRKRKLRTVVNKLRKRNYRLKKASDVLRGVHGVNARKRAAISHVLSELSNYLPEKTVNFVRNQINIAVAHKLGRRWNIHDKMFAMSVFYQSRKAYSLLQKIVFLPSPRTLQRGLQNCTTGPGFNSHIFNAMKRKFQHMTDFDKDCILMFDEMSLKKRLVYNRERDCVDGYEDYGCMGTTRYQADHALVFMLRGVSSKWKQPLGYFFVCGSVKPVILKKLVNTCLSKLENIGLQPVALVCDQGSTNRCCLETMCHVSVEQPYILHNDRKVYVIYDPPHLLKNIRNNFKKSGFVHHCEGDTHHILWTDVAEFHAFDKELPVRMAPKLTSKHLELPPFSSMRVNLAAQTLSHSVAAGIQTLSVLGKMRKEAEHTAKFIDQFDKLFNSFNSRTRTSSQPMGHAIAYASGHETFLNSFLSYLDELHHSKSARTLPCFSGWRISIVSILELWRYFYSQRNYKFLITSRFNQDCLENLFSTIRGSSGHCDNPDVSQFCASFRHIAVDRLFADNVGTNCEADCDKMLMDVESMSKLLSSHRPAEHDVPDCEMSCEDDFNIDFDSEMPLEVENVVAYMCGYLLRKAGFCDSTAACAACADLFILKQCPPSEDFVLLRNKAFKESGSLLYPTVLFCCFVQKLERVFADVFDKVKHTVGLMQKMIRYASRNVEVETCGVKACNEKVLQMMKLYFRVRIHAKLKFVNADAVSAVACKRNRKAKKVVHE